MVGEILKVKIPLKDRRMRFKKAADENGLKQELPLLLTKSIDQDSLKRIQQAISRLLEKYAVVVMKQNPTSPIVEHLDENFDLLKDMGKKLVGNCLEICDEVKDEYKNFHNAVCSAFDCVGLSDKIDLIQFPVNLRLKIGDFDPKQEHSNHPLSTSKSHVDIWAGAPACLTICIAEIINHQQGSKIEFRHVEKFPKSLAKGFGSYDEKGIDKFLATTEKIKVLSETGSWNLVDAYTPHQTVYRGRGVRISVDFRFSWKDKLDSDFPNITLPSDFKKYQDWRA